MKTIKSLFPSLDLCFSAKVKWRMKYDRNPLLVTLQNKYKVREYARSKGVKTATLLYATDRPETIPFGELPQHYLIKANHGTTQGIIFGELTIYPEAGHPASPTSCPVFNKWLGDQWKLSRTDVINAFCLNVVSGVISFGSRIVRKYRR